MAAILRLKKESRVQIIPGKTFMRLTGSGRSQRPQKKFKSITTSRPRNPSDGRNSKVLRRAGQEIQVTVGLKKFHPENPVHPVHFSAITTRHASNHPELERLV